MPIYEYQCSACRHSFECLVNSDVSPTCPTCNSASLQKRLSAFAVGRGRAEAAAAGQGPCGSCGDPRGAGACSMN
ncbi:MAG: zinc ribbon domain-containing protein [Acidobacteriota bacterium]|nr:zinc ribbon domain-containing protein [Acidobacteriota bacterium]